MLLSIYYRLYEIRKVYRSLPLEYDKWTPPNFFFMIYPYVNIMLHFALWYSLWQKSNSISALFLASTKYMEFTQFQNPKVFSPIIKYFGYFYCIVTIVFPAIITISGMNFLRTIEVRKLSGWFNGLVATGKDLLFISIRPNETLERLLGCLMIPYIYLRNL